MNDLISRQDAIDAVEERIQTLLKDEVFRRKCGDRDLYGVKRLIQNLPSAQQWIPCGERLPEDIKPVIVTWKNNNPPFYYQHIVGEHFTGVAHYKNNKWFWYSSVTEDVLAEYGRCDSEEIDGAIEVVAWMPLPQPWKEAEDEHTDSD